MPTITHEQLMNEIAMVLERHGLSYERFLELGKADELRDPELRDLWLMTKAVLPE